LLHTPLFHLQKGIMRHDINMQFCHTPRRDTFRYATLTPRGGGDASTVFRSIAMYEELEALLIAKSSISYRLE